jgi:hypothetical protein
MGDVASSRCRVGSAGLFLLVAKISRDYSSRFSRPDLRAVFNKGQGNAHLVMLKAE